MERLSMGHGHKDAQGRGLGLVTISKSENVAEYGGWRHWRACGRLWESALDKHWVLDPLGHGSFYQFEYT